VIVTLTPNPSHDRTVGLAGPFERGAVHRATSVTSQAGGKGVNISRAAVVAGVETLAVLPAPADDPFVLELRSAGIPCRPVPGCRGDLRTNITVTEPDGTTTKLNSPGPTVTPQVLDDLTAALVAAVTGDPAAAPDWVVLAGSLPPGAPHEWYADLVQTLAGTGARVALDTSEAPLRAVVDRLPDAAPALMKPNGDELASLTGDDAATIEADPLVAARAASVLLERGVGAVLATLGARGAVLATPDGAWHAEPPPTEVVSTVGAGDSSLFGYLMADLRGDDPAGRLALAVAYGSAAAGLPGTTIPTPQVVRPDLVRVRQLDPAAR
jgi:1-phosphofructokinase